MKNIILDIEAMIESVRKDGRRHDYKIDSIEVYEDCLYCRRRYINSECHEYVEYYLLPKENIGIYKLYQIKDAKFDPSEVYRYYIDMVSVDKSSGLWNAKDLYIDFIVRCDGRHCVVDIDEFNSAIERKELSQVEVNSALKGLDNVLKGFYEAFDMDAYIAKLRHKYMRDCLRMVLRESAV